MTGGPIFIAESGLGLPKVDLDHSFQLKVDLKCFQGYVLRTKCGPGVKWTESSVDFYRTHYLWECLEGLSYESAVSKRLSAFIVNGLSAMPAV